MSQQTFAEYTKEARDEFSKFINGKKWDGELRTKCEDLLIAYDQMKDKCDKASQLESDCDDCGHYPCHMTGIGAAIRMDYGTCGDHSERGEP